MRKSPLNYSTSDEWPRCKHPNDDSYFAFQVARFNLQFLYSESGRESPRSSNHQNMCVNSQLQATCHDHITTTLSRSATYMKKSFKQHHFRCEVTQPFQKLFRRKTSTKKAPDTEEQLKKDCESRRHSLSRLPSTKKWGAYC
ncbi:hypothetical protein L484_027891 [Morus notabilis]|uniref:Uncharacterized protein n=1 Tax=Morus notabilis TaxID=981085 RepID=W9S7I1_9ROSA|nr:hypothetical protein L484_027891 [Morus notabilis]